MPKSILDPAFQYTSSSQTDIGKRFKRIWNEQKAERKALAEAQRKEAEIRGLNVSDLTRKRKGAA